MTQKEKDDLLRRIDTAIGDDDDAETTIYTLVSLMREIAVEIKTTGEE